MIVLDIFQSLFTKCCFHLILVFVIRINGLSFKTCPPTETTIVSSTSSEATVVWVPPEVDKMGANIAVSHDHNPGDTFPVGNTTVHYTALNFSGTTVLEKTVCSFVVSVLDKTPPLIQCPYPITLNIPRERGSISLNWAAPTTYDNAGTVVVTSTHHPGDMFHLGVTLVTYTARDPSSNEATCSFNVTLKPIDHPTIFPKHHSSTPLNHKSTPMHKPHGTMTPHKTQEPGATASQKPHGTGATDPHKPHGSGATVPYRPHGTGATAPHKPYRPYRPYGTGATVPHKTHGGTASHHPAVSTHLPHMTQGFLPHKDNHGKTPTVPSKHPLKEPTPTWHKKIATAPKTPLNNILHGTKNNGGTITPLHKQDGLHHHDHHYDHDHHHDNPRMHRIDMFNENEQLIEVACIAFISLVLIALVILGIIYKNQILRVLRLRHERRRTPFPSTSWEQCPQMDGMNDPLLNQTEYTDYPIRQSSEKPLLQPGEVLPLLINGSKKDAKQK